MNDTSPLFGLRQPPESIQAEQALLGAIIANPKAMGLCEGLEPEHFADPIHGRIFGDARAMIRAGQVADAVTLKARYENAGVLEEVGGTPYLAQLLAAMVAIDIAADYARVIRECATRRKLIEIWQRAIDEAHGTTAPAEIAAIVAAAQIEASPAMQTAPGMFGRLHVLSMGDIIEAAPRDYLLKGIMSPGELSMWWGAPKCGKSFLLLHVSYAIAQRRADVLGRRVRGCPVLYVAAEGAPGLARRVQALRDRFGDAPDFYLIAQPVDLLHPFGDVASIIAAAKAIGAGLIVLDTFNRALAGGDENHPQDMGAMVLHIGEIMRGTGAHLAIVHHGAANSNKPRGHTSLIGAADAVVEVVKADDGARTATLTMAKDDADGLAMGFRLRVVEMGIDQDGDQITTIVVDEADEQATPAARSALNDAERKALGFLSDLILAEGRPLPIGSTFPVGLPGVPEDRWRAECDTRRLSKSEKKASRTAAFRRAYEGLEAKAIVAARDELVWLTRPPEPEP